LSNLDAALRGSMRVELARLHQRLGATMVYVTHDQVEAMTLGQRVAVLRDGRLEQVGAPLALYTAPVNTFVAGFLGTPRINLIPRPDGRSSPAHQSLWLHGVPSEVASAANQLGLRPEHLQLSAGGDGVPLRLVLAEHLGDTVVLHLQLDGVDSLLHAKVAPPSVLPEPGSIVHVKTVSGHALAFDAQGLRLAMAPSLSSS
jgi:multiple sugar transport system ATP-binding protein